MAIQLSYGLIVLKGHDLWPVQLIIGAARSRAFKASLFASSLADPQFIGRLQRGTAASANHSPAVSTSQGIGDFGGALRAVKRLRFVFWLWVSHEEENLAQNAKMNDFISTRVSVLSSQ